MSYAQMEGWIQGNRCEALAVFLFIMQIVSSSTYSGKYTHIRLITLFTENCILKDENKDLLFNKIRKKTPNFIHVKM